MLVQPLIDGLPRRWRSENVAISDDLLFRSTTGSGQQVRHLQAAGLSCPGKRLRRSHPACPRNGPFRLARYSRYEVVDVQGCSSPLSGILSPSLATVSRTADAPRLVPRAPPRE